MMWQTYDLLKFMGFAGHNYECHTPIRMTRSKFREVATLFINTERAAQHRYHGVCLRTAYGNIMADTAEAATAEQIKARLHGRRFLFHDDHGLTEAMKSLLAGLYPEKSRFELTSSTEGSRPPAVPESCRRPLDVLGGDLDAVAP